jgi:hypothetical protein
MEQQLLGAQAVSPDQLRQLGLARTQALFQLLLGDQVEPGRLFQVSGGPRAAQEHGAKVYFGLK